MAGGPTVIKFEEAADILIQKGGTAVELRADGSVYVNGIKVVEPTAAVSATVEVAAPVAEVQPAPQEQTIAAVVTTAPQAPVEPPPTAPQVAPPPAPAPQTPEEIRAERDRNMQRVKDAQGAATQAAIKEGKDFGAAAEAGRIAGEAEMEKIRQEKAARTAPVATTPVAAPQTATAVTPPSAQTGTQTTASVTAPTAAGTDTAPPVAVAPVVDAPPPPPVEPVVKIGETVEGKGVFVGTWQPYGSEGTKLSTVFNIYAAPEDLTDDSGKKVLLSFNAAAERVAALKDWHGHDGTNYANDTALISALERGKYKGGWVIPPLELMADGGRPGPLYAAKDEGDLEDTFTPMGKAPAAQWYWSSTEDKKDSDYVHLVRFNGGGSFVDYAGRDYNKLAVRPVRLEPRL